MFEFVIAVVAVLVVLAIVSKARKRTAEKANPAIAPKAQAQENKPVVKPIVNAEPEKEVLPEPVIAPETAVDVVVASPVALAHNDNSNDHLPQDSTLRRHYLTHLHAMIAALKPARPTDSTLSRHYDALIYAEIDQCLSEPAAIERLQARFDEHKKTAAPKIQQPKVVVEPVVNVEISQEKSALPEDSMLRRHAIQLNS